ncbi:MAG: DUF951 domain-containing protein [Saccharofermentans sp.]|nr:DUF951 domain-containing protein [Saccharofermentans sp.]
MPGKFYRYRFTEGEKVKLKKKHPCGSDTWEILSVGSEIKIKCQGCSHITIMRREAMEKAVTSIVTDQSL